ncbi:hypothetical protein BH11PLA2_BH11PLA2_45570 [soil metagenome]
MRDAAQYDEKRKELESLLAEKLAQDEADQKVKEVYQKEQDASASSVLD